MSGALGSFGYLGSTESFSGQLGIPSEGFLNSAPMLEKESWTRKKGRFPIVDSLSSFENLFLDDTVRFCENDLLFGEPLKSTKASQENLLPLPQLESDLTPVKTEIATEMLQPYSPFIRKAKIARYKLKLQHRRTRVSISRHFSGRSHVAKCKNRTNGKFTKT